MVSIEDRLQRIEDRAAIEDIIHRFCRAADRSDLTSIADLFHPDATDNHGLYEGDVPGLVSWLRERHLNIIAASHLVSNMIIEFADPDHALVETRLTTCIRYTPEGSAMMARVGGIKLLGAQSVDMLSFARYVDVFARRDGAWKISRRYCILDNNIVIPVADGSEITSPVMIHPRRDRDDIVFLLRRELGIE